MGTLPEPTLINGVSYYSVKQFAEIIHKTEQTVFFLMRKGNRIRKLKSIMFFDKPLIEASEVTAFPFTLPGKGTEIYYYDENGRQTEAAHEERSNDF